MSDYVLTEDQKYIAKWVKARTGKKLTAGMAKSDAFRAIADAIRTLKPIKK